MLANAAGIMPDELQFEADQRFFERGLDGVDVVAHGRHSQEQQPHSAGRRRLILTRQVPALAPDPTNDRALLWNPAGATFEQAWAAMKLPGGRLGVIGGTDVFGLFLDRYDVFYLSRAANVTLPGGRPVFPSVPRLAPEQVLAEHGYRGDAPEVLDRENAVTLVCWHRA